MAMRRSVQRALLFGLIAAGGMLAVYLGILTLVESWSHALSLLWEDALFVAPLAAGFGVQVGLYAFSKLALQAVGRRERAITGASGGTSTATMVACCAHHLTDVLPLVGISAAATFLARYKTWLMAGALLFNLAGIGVSVRQLRRHWDHLMGDRNSVSVPAPHLALERPER
jgi:hypothetical protein